MTEYLSPDLVDELVTRKGFTYKDRGLMLSALAAPLPVFGEEVYPDIHRKAAALVNAINRDHPLLDGNKRLSWYLAVAFYEFNGYDLRADAEDGDRYIRIVADHHPPLEDIAMWLDKHTRPFHDPHEKALRDLFEPLP